MVQKIFILFIFLLSFFLLFSFDRKETEDNKLISPKAVFKVTPSLKKYSYNETIDKSIFVTYWSLSNNLTVIDNYDNAIYFGIEANKEGINKEDPGYKKINQFIAIVSSKTDKFLALRMLDQDSNSNILTNSNLQSKIIDETLDFAKANGFKGIVLDFEMSSLYFESVVKNINKFNEKFYKLSKENNIKYYVLLYGDIFYRARPYDVSNISANSDKIIIMAYDFHKARGNPGPNFPLSGSEDYGYDFKLMIQDFIKKVPKEKIIIAFGFFGYDWKVNEKNESLENGKALSTNEIKNEYVQKCELRKCVINKDKLSLETKLSYTDNNFKKHIIWFEDLESVNRKMDFLKEKKINSVAFWAYSYF